MKVIATSEYMYISHKILCITLIRYKLLHLHNEKFVTCMYKLFKSTINLNCAMYFFFFLISSVLCFYNFVYVRTYLCTKQELHLQF